MENSEILTKKRGRKSLTEEERARKTEARRAERLKQRQTNMKERAAKFWKRLIPYISTYGKPMVDEFYIHYTMTNENCTRMRFELCRFFDLEKRLYKWCYYERHYFYRNRKKKDQQQTSTTMSSAESAKLRETLSKSEERERQWEQQRKEAVTYEQYLAMKKQQEEQGKE